MDRLISPIEKRLDATCEKLFGDDSQLSCAYKMAAMNATEEELTQAIYIMQSMNAELAKEINADMQYTLDSCGNVVELPRIELIEDLTEVNKQANEKAFSAFQKSSASSWTSLKKRA